jgi:hypothetical protein
MREYGHNHSDLLKIDIDAFEIPRVETNLNVEAPHKTDLRGVPPRSHPRNPTQPNHLGNCQASPRWSQIGPPKRLRSHVCAANAQAYIAGVIVLRV